MRKHVLSLVIVCLLPASMPAALEVPEATVPCRDCAASLPLPTNAVTVQATTNDHLLNSPASTALTYITGSISNSPAGSALPNGSKGLWCGDWFNASLSLNQTYVPYSTYGDLPFLSQNAAWPKINWVLTNKQGTAGDVQRAIWVLCTGNG